MVNQIWKFAGGSYREELAERVKLFGRYREFDKAIKAVMTAWPRMSRRRCV